MTHRPLGSSGLMVSAVGIGCNAFSRRVNQDGVGEILDVAQESGVTLLDTADIYGVHPGASEELLGHALLGRREEFVLATKFGMDMQGANGADHGARGSRRYVRRAVEASLRRLQQVADADWTSRTTGHERFTSVQNRYSLLDRELEDEVGPAAEKFGLGVLPFFPLEYGLLTGKYERDSAAPEGSRAAVDPSRSSWLAKAEWDRIEAIEAYAEERSLSLLDVAIAGLAAQPAVSSVISGATRGEQVRANAAALRWEPSDDDLAELNEL